MFPKVDLHFMVNHVGKRHKFKFTLKLILFLALNVRNFVFLELIIAAFLEKSIKIRLLIIGIMAIFLLRTFQVVKVHFIIFTIFIPQ